MKILFWGRGVIGPQYVWAFEKAGHTVAFYVREGRKTQYSRSQKVWHKGASSLRCRKPNYGIGGRIRHDETETD